MKYTMNNPKKKKQAVHSLKRLLMLTVPYIGMIILAVICTLLVNAAVIAKPYVSKLVIDDFLINRVENKGLYSITFMGILYFLIVAFGGFFSIAQANLINKVSQNIMKNLRRRVFKVIQFLPLPYLDKMPSGRLITRATNDVESLNEMYSNVLINLFKDIFLLVGIIYAMIAMNIRLALVSLCMVPLLFIFVFLLKKKIKDNFKRVKHLIGRINGFMAENISGMKIVQIFRGEKEKSEEFRRLNNEYYKATVFQVWLNSILKPSAEIIQSLSIAILIWYGMGKVSDQVLEIGVLYAFTTYVKQFFNPISELADSYTTIQSALVSADRIFELLNQEDILEDLDSGINMSKFKGDIEFRNVWFAYNEEDWILKDISFKIGKGQTAAFVGETGAGKTTIINLISGFYKIQRGEILIDGININEIKLRDLRENIAVVLQDVFLFSGNIEKNITLNDEINEDIIEDALQTSYAEEFTNNLPMKLKEPVMERGSTFSAGQKQLISFARALAHSPSVLVLDEATSNVDTETEMLIQKAVENVSKDRTTLVIAHRLSTIRGADKIIVLKSGQIVETGNHSELIKKDGYYKRLIDQLYKS